MIFDDQRRKRVREFTGACLDDDRTPSPVEDRRVAVVTDVRQLLSLTAAEERGRGRFGRSAPVRYPLKVRLASPASPAAIGVWGNWQPDGFWFR